MSMDSKFKPLRERYLAIRNTKPGPSIAPLMSLRTESVPQTDSPIPAPYPRPNLPRLYLSGRFYNDPPTVNNLVGHYDTERFRPSYQLTTDEINFNGAFCPQGTGTFTFVDCEVQARYSPAHGVSTAQKDETLIGKTIDSNGRSVCGKLVDLDPQFQNIFTLYGARIIIGEGDDSFAALLMPASSRNMWYGIRNPDAEGKAYNKGASATFQGILKIEHVNAMKSTFLNECAEYLEKSKSEEYPLGALSIRFRTDSYSNDYTAADFCYGNLTAYITPWLPGYPASFNAGRQLSPTVHAKQKPSGSTTKVQIVNRAHAHLEKNPKKGGTYSLLVDLVNSLYRVHAKGTQTADGWRSPYEDYGELKVGYMLGGDFKEIAEIPYKEEQFDLTSCIFEIGLSENSFEVLCSHRLAIISTKSTDICDKTELLFESCDGIFASADRYIYRIEPDAPAQSVEIYVSRFGRLQKNHTVHVCLDSTLMQTDGQSGETDSPEAGVPESVLNVNNHYLVDGKGHEFVVTAFTGEDGIARLNIAGTDPGNPRRYIDGQLYGLSYSAGPLRPFPSDEVIGNDKITILLFNKFIEPKHRNPPRKPSWVSDVLPIFQQYANLYPSMARVVRLDDYSSVVSRKYALLRVFTANEDSADYMPTKRDLSAHKKNMIVDWLKDDAPYMHDSKEDLYRALQLAVEIEHATMPPYLTALYSIKPGHNAYVAKTLREVVMEEMLHMAISCNILIAIGQAPTLDSMGVVPRYPGPLPGGVCEDLIVGLRKCSPQQIRIFERIETPNNVYITEDGVATITDNVDENKVTIGWIYSAISATLKSLHAKKEIKFPNDLDATDPDEAMKRRERQVLGPFKGKLRMIETIDDAVALIETVKEQGEGKEGANFVNPTDDGHELAHYFRFAELGRGRRLTYKKDARGRVTEYAFNGPPVSIDMDGVYNMQDDPKIELQPIGSRQRDRMNAFACKYRALLKGLHKAFNGEPDYIETCFGLMFQLTMAAQPLMEMPALEENGEAIVDGSTCGISFQMPIDELITYHVGKSK